MGAQKTIVVKVHEGVFLPGFFTFSLQLMKLGGHIVAFKRSSWHFQKWGWQEGAACRAVLGSPWMGGLLACRQRGTTTSDSWAQQPGQLSSLGLSTAHFSGLRESHVPHLCMQVASPLGPVHWGCGCQEAGPSSLPCLPTPESTQQRCPGGRQGGWGLCCLAQTCCLLCVHSLCHCVPGPHQLLQLWGWRGQRPVVLQELRGPSEPLYPCVSTLG